MKTRKDLAANWLPFGRIISLCKTQPNTPLSFISSCFFSCFNLSSNAVHLTVGFVNNVGKPWERVAYLMRNRAWAQKISFLKKRKEKTQSHIIGLLFRFSQLGILVKLRFSYELSSKGTAWLRQGSASFRPRFRLIPGKNTVSCRGPTLHGNQKKHNPTMSRNANC